jgi:anti-anti-sigma factor
MCRPIGNLDRYSFADFAAQVSSLIRPHVHLVFDLVELGSIDSTGVSALLASARRVRRRGGRVSVCNASAHVADLLAQAGMDAVGPSTRRRDGLVPWPQPAS